MAKTLVLICFKVTEISNVQIQSLSSVNIHQRGRNISHLKRVLFILWLGSLKWNCQNNPTHWTIPSLCNIAYQGKPLKGPSSFNEIALSSPFVKEGTIFKLPHLNHQERVKHRNIMYHFFCIFQDVCGLCGEVIWHWTICIIPLKTWNPRQRRMGLIEFTVS